MDAFWGRVSEEIGAPVLAYGLGRYLSGRDAPGPLWGLLYHSERSFYFRHFAQQNWFSSLLTASRTNDAPGSSGDREVLYEIPLAHIAEVQVIGAGSWVERFFHPSPPVVTLIGVFESAPPFRCTIENNRDSFISSLESSISQKT